MERLLTIGITSYNREDILKRNLSVLLPALKGKSIRVVITVDGTYSDSFNEFIENCNKWLGDTQIFWYPNFERRGVYANKITCLDFMMALPSKYFILMDDDDPFNISVLESVYASLNTASMAKDIPMIFCNILKVFTTSKSDAIYDRFDKCKFNPAISHIGTVFNQKFFTYRVGRKLKESELFQRDVNCNKALIYGDDVFIAGELVMIAAKENSTTVEKLIEESCWIDHQLFTQMYLDDHEHLMDIIPNRTHQDNKKYVINVNLKCLSRLF